MSMDYTKEISQMLGTAHCHTKELSPLNDLLNRPHIPEFTRPKLRTGGFTEENPATEEEFQLWYSKLNASGKEEFDFLSEYPQYDHRNIVPYLRKFLLCPICQQKNCPFCVEGYY